MVNSLRGHSISWRSTLLVWISVGLLAGLFSVSPAGQWIERTIAQEWFFELRGIRSAPDGVAVVSMNKRGSDLPAVTRSDRLWSRKLFASIVDRLSAAGAALIVMDVTFEDVGEEASDRALEESLARSGRVVMFLRITRTQEGDVSVRPLPRFAAAARTLAVFPLPKEHRVDSYWPFFPTQEPTDDGRDYREYPSLPVAALQTRLVDEFGVAPFQRLLSVSSTGEQTSVDTHTNDLSSLIAGLRSNFTSGPTSGQAVLRLASEHPDDGLPVATMLDSLMFIYAARGHVPVNFYGPSRTIDTLDHMTVLSDLPEDVIALEQRVSGHVVFIGHSPLSAVDQMDGMPTVYTRNGLDLSGVEIAATAYANLIDGSVLRLASTPLTIAVHVLLGVVSAFLAFRTNMLQAIVLTVALAAVYLAGCIGLFTHAHSVLPLGVPILILLPIVLFSILLLRYFSSDKQAGFYRHGIQQFLPPRATDAFEKGNVEGAESEPLYGTCMITDIEDFTHYSEKLGHERISSLSQEYFSQTIKQVVDSGGELISVDGDGVTALWGSTEKSSQGGINATEAAIGIKRHVEQFNTRHPDTPFVTRIGLDCGWIEARYLGTEGNYRYSLVGDAANTSSRLEGLNKRLGSTVLASSDVVAGNENLLVRRVGVFLLKGKSNALEVVEIVGGQYSAMENERVICTRFSEIIDLVLLGEFDTAQKQLVNFMQMYGTDGPARFYLELLSGRGSHDVYLDSQGIVHLEGK